MDVFDLQAKIRLDDSAYKSGLSAIKGTLGDFAKFSTATLGAAAAGVSAIVKESVSAYADYEQLAGGIETLFGSSADTVMKNAEKAYLTAGQSMNEYMETSIQSAASLINSLGGDQAKAAELMDLSITDMSDNVNKLGTSMEAVQNAYRGFSRGNFTMLDNLALGFAGTKEGMQELLDKAQEISGIQYDISSYSDIVQAIHVVQEEMGITGTTAKEASGTISGSIGSVKAAWQNLKIEISKDDGNIGDAFDNLSETAGAAFDNMLPRVEKALDGVGSLIVKAAPKIGQSIAKIVPKVLPSLMETSVSVISAIGTSIVDSLPTLLETGGEVVETIGNTLLGYLPDWLSGGMRNIFGSIKDFISDIDFDRLKESFGGLVDSFEPLAETLVNGVSWAFENVLKPLGTWLTNEALPVSIDLVSAAFDNIKNVLDMLAPIGKTVWDEFLSPLFSAVGDLTVGSLDMLAGALKTIGEAFKDFDTSGFIDDINNGDFFEDWKIGMDMIGEGIEGFGEKIDDFFSANGAAQKWNDFWQGVGGLVADAKNTIVTSIDAIKDAIGRVSNAISEFQDNWGIGVDVIFDGARSILPKLGDGVRGGGHTRHAKGGVFTSPTYDRFGDLYGEAGTEVLLPLDNNTAWMDKFADKLENKMDGGVKYTFNFYYQGGNGMSDAEVEEQARRLAELSIAQIRSIGGTGF